AVDRRQTGPAPRRHLRGRLAEVAERGGKAIAEEEPEVVVEVDAADVVRDLAEVPVRGAIDAIRAVDRHRTGDGIVRQRGESGDQREVELDGARVVARVAGDARLRVAVP